MSGLWSFREPTFATGMTGSTLRDARQCTTAVIQVLPVGVEFRASFLSPTSEAAHATSSAPHDAWPHVSATHLHKPACTSYGGFIDGSTNAEKADAHVPVPTSCAGVHGTTWDASADAAVVGEAADLIDRDEVVSEVQRGWWRALDVDIRPAADLFYSTTTDTSGSCDIKDMGEMDEEARRTAQLLLARAVSLDDGGIVCTAEANASQHPHHARVMSKVDIGRLQTHQAPVAGSKEQRAGVRLSSCPKSSATPSRRATEHREPAGQRREESATAAALPNNDQNKESTPSCKCTDVHPLSGRRAHHSSFSSTTSTLCLEGCCPFGRSGPPPTAQEMGAAQAAPPVREFVPHTGPVLPSEPLQRAMQTTTPTPMRCGATHGGGVAEPVRLEENARVMLERYFAMWRDAAEKGLIRRGAASYHQYLMQCVRDVLGGT